MMLKNLLVIVEPSKDAGARIDLAVALAKEHGAHVTGLHVGAPPSAPPMVASQFSEPARKALLRAARQAADDAERLFREHTENQDVRTTWRHLEGDVAAASLHARYADLVIAGQPGPATEDADSTVRFLAHLFMAAGRPVLVVPHGGEHKSVGKRVLVAWNASREAARALSDALPILEKASKVLVVAINPQPGGPSGGTYAGHDIAHELLRHGVKAEHERVSEYDKGAGEVLLARAADYKADLLVMGAYGHTRFREIVLGGATRHVLRHAHIPVLFSH
jgi:nucleotide-binding universal stress UspA family protein